MGEGDIRFMRRLLCSALLTILCAADTAMPLSLTNPLLDTSLTF